MPHMPACQASAVLRAALRAGAGDARAHGIAALILALLLRLFGAADAAWTSFPACDDEDEDADDGFIAVAFRDPSWHASPIYQPQIGRAPHDIHVECGQVPGYVMAGVHNRGMRATRPANPRPRRPRPAPGFT